MKLLHSILFFAVCMIVGHSCTADEPAAQRLPDLLPAAYYNPTDTADGVLRVLAIGNSFSCDAMECYLWSFFEEFGIEAELVDVRKESGSLQIHCEYAKNNKAEYTVWRYKGGEMTTAKNEKLHDVLVSGAWDVVTMQQVSQLSGDYPSIKKYLPSLLGYVHARVPAETSFVWHQTWAYAQDCERSGFDKYGYSQTVMYKAIVDASQKVMDTGEFAYMIPAGAAVQMAREYFPESAVTKDGSHLESPVGHFVVACVWFEMLTGIDARKINSAPSTMTQQEAAVCKEVAHASAQRSPSMAALTMPPA